MRRCAAVVVASLWAVSVGWATVPRSEGRFDRLGLEEGLSQSVVVDILQDRRGFLWLATQDGLNRFDGHEFVVLRHDRTSRESLSASNITALAEDGDGALWVGTTEGLDRIDPVDGRIHRMDLQRRPEDAAGRHVWCLLVQSDGTILVGTGNGLLVMSGSAVTEVRGAGVGLGRVVSLFEARDGTVWAGTNQRGLFRLDRGAAEASPVVFEGTSDSYLWGVVEDEHGRLWVASTGGLLTFDPVDGGSRRLFPDWAINDILVDRDGVVWLAFYGEGLGVFDPGEAILLRRFRHDPAEPRSPVSDFVNCLAEDASGTIWAGTWGHGTFRYSPSRDKFTHLRGGGGPGRLASAEVYALWSTADHLWVGTADGLELVWRESGEVDPRPVTAEPLASGWFYALRVDERGRLWAGVYDEGLVIHDPTSGRTEIHRHDAEDPGSIASSVVNRIEPDGQGRMWLATAAGLDLFDPAHGVVVEHVGGDRGLPTEGILTVLVSPRSGVWVGTDGAGLAVLDLGASRFRTVYDGTTVAGIVLCLAEDGTGGIWAGTDGDGLVRYDPTTAEIEVVAEDEGLPNNVIYGLAIADDGAVWAASNQGLARVDRVSGSITAFDHRDGLQGNEFNQGAYHRADDGELFFGGIHGLNRFYPDRLPLNRRPPPVALTALEVDNRALDLGPLARHPEVVELGPGTASLSFRVAALDLADPERNRYHFLLEGFNPDWVEAGSRRFATYTNLEPGSYTFRVAATNADGTINRDALSIRVEVEPPLWRRPWFQVVVAILLIAILGAGHRLRVYAIERDRRRLEVQVAERTAELAEANEKKNLLLGVATHELRQPLNIISGYLDIVLSRLGTERFQAEEADKLLGRARRASATMQDLIEELLDLAAIESGKVELELAIADLGAVLEECLEIHQRDAERKDITLEYRAVSLPELAFDRARMVEIVDNLVSNAIKYTWPGGLVAVTGEVRDDAVVVSVTDTGQGLGEDELEALFTEFSTLSSKPTAGEKSTGLGLAIVRKLVRLHGGEVWATSTRGEGSTFSFSLPRPGAPRAPRGSAASPA